jgi:hypothetical protein
VEAAKADGRWEAAYAAPPEAEVLDELVAAIAAVPAALGDVRRPDQARRTVSC